MRQLEERTAFGPGRRLTDPFTGETGRCSSRSLPDVAVVQVQTADAEGNAWILGPRWDNTEQARASKRTIVIAEQVVPGDVIRQEPRADGHPGSAGLARGRAAFRRASDLRLPGV